MIETALFTFHTGTDGFAARLDLPALHRWTLAVCQAARFFRHVLLVTDARGRYLLGDRLGLPFTEIREELDAVPAHVSYLPCAGKLWGYRTAARAGAPFLSLDGDVFLWRKPEARLLEAPAVAQDVHPIPPRLRQLVGQLARFHPAMPRAAESCCAGLLGGHDTAGLLAYAEQAIALLTDPRHEPLFRAAAEPWHPISACEEALFAARFADRIQSFTPPHPTRADFAHAGFTHLLGLKGDSPSASFRELQVETRLALDHPAYRPRIADLWWHELSLEIPGHPRSFP